MNIIKLFIYYAHFANHGSKNFYIGVQKSETTLIYNFDYFFHFKTVHKKKVFEF